MRTLRPMSVSFSLTEADYPDSGLICGGRLTVYIEPITLPVVHVFGAGHVGAETARLAHGAGFRVRLYDDRQDMLAAARAPAEVERVPGAFEDTACGALAGDVNLVIVVTRGHHDDERVLRCLSRAGAPPRFLGMIGSRTKRRLLVERLAAEGVPRAFLDRVVSPVGLPIGARTAPEIALSIVAQLVSECRGGGMGGEARRRETGEATHAPRRAVPRDAARTPLPEAASGAAPDVPRGGAGPP
jgi:xanthine dehydrogenase accessory factor